MSHFTVLVVGPNLAAQLEPFQENNMGDCPRKYMEFHDNEDEYLKDYAEGSVEMVVLEDGSLAYTWDERFRTSTGDIFSKPEPPAHLERRTVFHKDRYETFEEFVADWHGDSERDEEKGRFGYWENPNAKWDWYALGGRWTGYFKLKPGAKGATGEPGLMTERAKVGYADAVLKKDIDFDSMRAKAVEEANERYALYEGIIREHGSAPDFVDFRKDYGDDHAEARKQFYQLPVIQALNKAGLVPWDRGINETYGVGREKFVENAANSAVPTFALLLNGKWYERGQMGWWGCVSEEKADGDWNAEFTKLLESLPDDTLLSVVDCHI